MQILPIKTYSGFTLIELVVVIAILGILAAVALPKFIDLSKDGRIASIQAMEGSMRTANLHIYAKSAIQGKQGDASNTVDMGGRIVGVTYGHASTVTGLVMGEVSHSYDAFNIIANRVEHKKAIAPATCSVTYSVIPYARPDGTWTADTSYVVNTDGC